MTVPVELQPSLDLAWCHHPQSGDKLTVFLCFVTAMNWSNAFSCPPTLLRRTTVGSSLGLSFIANHVFFVIIVTSAPVSILKRSRIRFTFRITNQASFFSVQSTTLRNAVDWPLSTCGLVRSLSMSPTNGPLPSLSALPRYGFIPLRSTSYALWRSKFTVLCFERQTEAKCPFALHLLHLCPSAGQLPPRKCSA